MLEAAGRTGGHVRTVRDPLADGLYVDGGAEHFTRPGYELFWGYVEELGLTALPYPRRRDMLRLIEREKVTMWSALGGTGARIASHPTLRDYDLSSVTSVGFGGAPTSPAVQEMIREAFPNASDNLGIGYGSSETVAVATSLRGREYREHPESAGRVEARRETKGDVPRREWSVVAVPRRLPHRA